jgi:hypothetical protein
MQSAYVLGQRGLDSIFPFGFHEKAAMNARPGESRELPEVLDVFQKILGSLPPGSAVLETERRPDGEVRVKLSPSNPHSATIIARGGKGMGYDLIVGNGTLFEILPNDRSLGDRSADDELLTICLAVIEGNFEETVYSVGKRIVKTIGQLTVDDKVTRTRQWHDFVPFFPKKKRVIKYAPYAKKPA